MKHKLAITVLFAVIMLYIPFYLFIQAAILGITSGILLRRTSLMHFYDDHSNSKGKVAAIDDDEQDGYNVKGFVCNILHVEEVCKATENYDACRVIFAKKTLFGESRYQFF